MIARALIGALLAFVALSDEQPAIEALQPFRLGAVEGSCLPITQFEDDAPSKTWSGTISRQGILFWLIGVRVNARGLGAWNMTITEPDGRVVAGLQSQDVPNSGFEWWSPEIKNGARMTIAGDLRGLRLQVSNCVPGSSEQELKSTIPPDDAKDIDIYRNESLYTWGKSVARLKVLDAGGYFSCTAVLVAPDRLLTNEHCTSKSWKTMTAEFDAETGNLGQTDPQPVVAVIRTDQVVDVALLQLGKPVQRPPARIATADVPSNASSRLVVVHHPSGKVKHASRDDCNSTSDGATAATQFPHTCDTSKGSSGSPVFASDGTVIGLHRKGFREGKANGRNEAVRASEINKFLNSK